MHAEISIQYIGQIGIIMRRNDTAIAVDPYLSDSVDRLEGYPDGFWKRAYPAPVEAGSLRDLDLVLCTHEHLDHLDPETLVAIAAASPACMFAAPRICIPLLRQCGIADDRLVAMKVNECLPFMKKEGGHPGSKPVAVHPIPAWHEIRETDHEGWDRYLGYLLEWDDITLYHAGDTILTEGLLDALAPYSIDIGFLPINGRDLFRNRLHIPGNLNAREAVELAAELGLDVVVPVHFDLYPNNGEAPGSFVNYLFQRHLGQKFHIFQPGETWAYRKLV